ncbi:MAG: 1,2-phenylacetyl-CoA epoxidase subunit PaaD [Acidobacteriota bacterium]
MAASKEEILRCLAQVKDPEIPVLDIVEMGIVREVQIEEGRVRVAITPTYSGCPAMKMIEDEIVARLHSSGHGNVLVEEVYAPAWTTDFMSQHAKEKLKGYGIAPPLEVRKCRPTAPPEGAVIPCPFCDSPETELRSEFGSTACKAFYYCRHCRQPFEYFKPI